MKSCHKSKNTVSRKCRKLGVQCAGRPALVQLPVLQHMVCSAAVTKGTPSIQQMV